MKNRKKLNNVTSIVLLLVIIIGFVALLNIKSNNISTQESYNILDIPNYSGQIYITINNNIPVFTQEDINSSIDYYSDLNNERVRNGNDKNELEQSEYR